jgi:hypothetical protein
MPLYVFQSTYSLLVKMLGKCGSTVASIAGCLNLRTPRAYKSYNFDLNYPDSDLQSSI